MTDTTTKCSTRSKSKLLRDAARVLQNELGPSGVLPEPSELPRAILAVPLSAAWGRIEMKRAQLRAFKKAHAWRLLINASGRTREYSLELRRFHGLPKVSKLIGCLLRSLVTLSADTAADRDRASQRYAEWSQGVRYLNRQRILPNRVIKFGMQKGEGISAWAKRERAAG
jgi:hypothetical protein